MIDKKECFCSLQEKNVTAIVEQISKGRGKGSETLTTFLNCDDSSTCNRESFCKFVNPLTTRIPLETITEQTALTE
ncbi:MAG: hypothetical protein ACYTFY_03185 [Planctomycetota bacterium]|jgi:hypothetical protein